MIIVFVNLEEQTLTICDKVVKVLPLSKKKLIRTALEGKSVIYVTDAIVTDGESVIDMVSDYSTEDNDTSVSQNMYLHTTDKGTMLVNYQGKTYSFRGVGDLKLLETLPPGMLETCPTIVNGIESGVFEIVSEDEKISIEAEYKAKQAEFMAKRNSTIVDSDVSVSDIIKGNKKSKSAFGTIDNPIKMDL